MNKRAHLFPFDDAMAFGFGVLAMAPDAFWRMTPRELRAAASRYATGYKRSAMSKERFAELMREFPDAVKMKEA